MRKIKAIKINIVFIIIVVFIFLCLIFKLVWVGTGNVMVKGETLASFASKRHTVKKTIYAKRGTIYSSGGEVLAKDVNSYTVIAYLEPSRTKDMNNPYHVVDKELTAKKLSPLINMTEERIIELLSLTYNKCDEDNNCEISPVYQVELGPGGRGITQLLKEQIEELDLPGIDFLSSTKRYYPNGRFASYTLGYAKSDNQNKFKGEMGVELFYNKELTGKDGYIEYQSDLYGYQITTTPDVSEDAISGNDVYLTLDTNIQMFTEQAIATMAEAKPEWATIAVMNAKTGEILGVASTPSFDNNTLEIKSYYDPFVSYTYEPGSTMKIFSFMAAMENGIYDGNKKFKSGSLKVDNYKISDWNKNGWGNITYDEGFMGSSNVAASKLALELGRAKLKDYYNKLGFGKKTGISLPNEGNGVINFKYNTEIASASYGQGVSVTFIQMLQALSSLGNEGTMVKPYIVSKIVNPVTGEVVLENKRTEVAKVASKETVTKVIDLMRGVVDGRSSISTGTGYYIKGYDLVGKTGTAEIASSSGGYLTGASNYVRSFAGVFPGDDPEIVIYAASGKVSSTTKTKSAVKELVINVGTYLNLYDKRVDKTGKLYTTDTYVNKSVNDVVSALDVNNMDSVVLGEGTKIINQYPPANNKLSVGSKIFLVTNDSKYIMPNIKGWSRNEVNVLATLLGFDVSFEGVGYVKSFNIEAGSEINKDTKLEVVLDKKYKET
ncbi:MAG: penicillin-binding protein [Bacilli bacterium]|nr:penicillin-binding protein [Bacilli bacterium]